MHKIQNQLLPFSELFIGLILLIKELYQMTVLPSIYDKTYALVDFFKYKESTYSLIFLWTLILITGFVGLINKQYRWFANQTLIVVFLSGSIIPAIFSVVYSSHNWIAWGLVVIGILIVQYVFYKSSLTKRVLLTKTNVAMSILLGLISSIVFWTIELA